METVLAVIAILLSLTSLIWQVLSWKLASPRLSTTPRFVVTSEGDIAQIELTVTNKGRAAIDILRVDLRFDRPFGFDLTSYLAEGSPGLPYRLSDNSSVTFAFRAPAVCQAISHHLPAPSWPIRFVVQLGNGTLLQTDGWVDLPNVRLAGPKEDIKHGPAPVPVRPKSRKKP